VERVGSWAGRAAGIATRYESTVDREYLHFVETHLVEEAGMALAPMPPDELAPAAWSGLTRLPVSDASGETGREDHAIPADADRAAAGGPMGLAGSFVGLPSVLIDCTVDVRATLDVKRRAMLAHASQIPPDSSAMRLGAGAFAEVYGFEWYARHGPPGPIDELPRC
jgi:hypothetical protein